MSNPEVFTGSALETALNAGELQAGAAESELRGRVKASERDGHIAFAPPGSETWVDLPSSLIDRATQIGGARSGEAGHPVFALTLSKGADPEVRALAALLSASGAARPPPPGFDRSAGGGWIPPRYPGGGSGPQALAATFCKNTRRGWLIDNTMCGRCAAFRIVCRPGVGCRWEQISPWKNECWEVEAGLD